MLAIVFFDHDSLMHSIINERKEKSAQTANSTDEETVENNVLQRAEELKTEQDEKDTANL